MQKYKQKRKDTQRSFSVHFLGMLMSAIARGHKSRSVTSTHKHTLNRWVSLSHTQYLHNCSCTVQNISARTAHNQEIFLPLWFSLLSVSFSFPPSAWLRTQDRVKERERSWLGPGFFGKHNSTCVQLSKMAARRLLLKCRRCARGRSVCVCVCVRRVGV